MQEFDYIVVGGGPAGCVLASRLSEDPDVHVALVEAGPDRRGVLANCTAAGMIALVPRKNASNYGFATTAQTGLKSRSDFHPLGRGLGGGGAINSLMYLRGHPSDYDGWAAMGNTGWAYADVLNYFKKAENNQSHHDDFHGNTGPMWVEELRTDNPYHGIVKQACKEAGLPFNPDFNGAEQEGYNSVQVMMKNGERFHTGKAYIHPYLGVRQNLTLLADTLCQRVLFEGTKAVGVEVVRGGQVQVLRSRREVIVSGGGILSAKLLMLSGVGPGPDLQALGLPVVQALPGVGQNLMDHLDFILGYHIPGDTNLLGLSPAFVVKLVRAFGQYRRARRGMLASNFAELTGFMRLTPHSPKPEIQYEFLTGLASSHGREIYAKHGMSAHTLLLHPKSRGSVKLVSPDPTQAPAIDMGYLSHPEDMPILLEGVKRVARIFETPTFKALVKGDVLNGHCVTDADWEDAIRSRAGTNYHPVGTCAMGTGSDAVVDPQLRVHGVQGLRVVDSSIMPRITGGNTMAPSIMIGEKGADMVKAYWKQPNRTTALG